MSKRWGWGWYGVKMLETDKKIVTALELVFCKTGERGGSFLSHDCDHMTVTVVAAFKRV